MASLDPAERSREVAVTQKSGSRDRRTAPERSARGDQQCLRLEGEVQGARQIIDLQEGPLALGSARSNDIILPFPGVSRQHARLAVQRHALEICDLGSTNGTYVDGRPVQRGTARPGAVLRFGNVHLRLALAEAADCQLGLRFGTEPRASRATHSSISLSQPSTELRPVLEAEMEPWLQSLADFALHLGSSGLEAALAHLASELKLQGCCAALWPPGEEPRCLAAWGVLPPFGTAVASAFTSATGQASARLFEEEAPEEITRPSDPGPSPGDSAQDSSQCLERSNVSPHRLALGVQRTADGQRLGLVLSGDFVGRCRCAPWLRHLVRLLAGHTWLRQAARQPTPSPRELQTATNGTPTLRFPSGYRVATSAPMRRLYQEMAQLLHGDLPVLIHGETGVGKEHLARILHDSGEQRDGPFVAINCAAIPADLMEAELFGIGRGVATGVEARRGKLELASGGTLFLDEVGEMCPKMQPKLLRALQEGEVQPVGLAARPIHVRVISATNARLMPASGPGQLRPDLFFRLAGCVLEVPPLRRCSEDIPGLVKHFLDRHAPHTTSGPGGVTVAVLRQLCRHSWPGNIRELEHEVRRLALCRTPGRVLRLQDLSNRLRESPTYTGEHLQQWARERGDLELVPALQEAEAQLILRALDQAEGHRQQASRLLGLSRNGLRKKMLRLGLAP